MRLLAGLLTISFRKICGRKKGCSDASEASRANCETVSESYESRYKWGQLKFYQVR